MHRPPHSGARVADDVVERTRRLPSNLVVAFSGVHPCTPLPMTMKGASVLLLKQLVSTARREAMLGTRRPRSVPGPTKPAVVRTDPRNATVNARARTHTYALVRARARARTNLSSCRCRNATCGAFVSLIHVAHVAYSVKPLEGEIFVLKSASLVAPPRRSRRATCQVPKNRHSEIRRAKRDPC